MREELQSERQGREEIQRARDGIVAKRLDLENELQVNFFIIMKDCFMFIVAITTHFEDVVFYCQSELILLVNVF